MKVILSISACLIISAAVHAQTSTTPAAKPAGTAKPQRTAIGGSIKDARKQPIAKVQAFIYRNDTIIGSGFTGADGNYETSSVMPGTYSLRLVYPSTGKRVTVSNVPVKALKVTAVSLNTAEPEADSAISYAELMPKTEVKKK